MHPRLSAVLWVILLINLQVLNTTGHHHSAAEHSAHRAQEWRQRQSLDLPHAKQATTTTFNKSSKLWLINSNPDQNNRPFDSRWAFQGWHNHLAPTTTTTTTTTSRPTPNTPFPSLWKNYAPPRKEIRRANTTRPGGLNPKTG